MIARWDGKINSLLGLGQNWEQRLLEYPRDLYIVPVKQIHTVPETKPAKKKAPENGWGWQLEEDKQSFPIGAFWPIFRCELYVF